MSQPQCSAITSRGPNAGKQCRRLAVRGSEKCQAHGGGKYKPNDVIAKALDGIPKAQCSYPKRNGERCKNPPIPGSTVCRKHGGNAAHIQRKAKQRLMSMVEPALVELNKILTNSRTSDGDKLRAISMVLDRTGYGKGSNITHEVVVRPWEQTMETILTELPADYGFEDVPVYGDIEDAEVVKEQTLPEVMPVRPDFDGPRIGPINGGDVGLIRTGAPKVTDTVSRPARRSQHADD